MRLEVPVRPHLRRVHTDLEPVETDSAETESTQQAYSESAVHWATRVA